MRIKKRKILALGESFEDFLNSIPDVDWWHLQEAAGSVIVNTDPTLNGTNVGAEINKAADGNLGRAYGFDGATTFGNIYSAALNAKLNTATGTIIIFFKAANAAVWTDGTTRRLIALTGTVGASNNITVFKLVANNSMRFRYVAGGTADQVDVTLSPTNTAMAAFTWDTGPADEIEVFLNAISQGVSPGLGVWADNLAVNSTTLAAADTVPAQVWNGDMTRVGLATRKLTINEISEIWSRSGLL